MFETSNAPSLSDIAAVTGNTDGFGGNNGWWVLILLFAIFGGWGGNGYGNSNYSGTVPGYSLSNDMATLSRQMDREADTLMNGQTTIDNRVSDGFGRMSDQMYTQNLNLAGYVANAQLERANQQAALMQQMNQNRYDNLQNFNSLQSAMQQSFCQTNYNNANNTRDIIDAQNANTQAILAQMQADKTAAMQDKIAEQASEIQALRFQASQTAQNAYLTSIIRPYNGCGCS